MVNLLVIALALSGAPQDDARAAFTAGRGHFAAGRHAEALPHLERAYQLSNKRPSTIRALAQCHRALDNFEQAIGFFREYLATSPSQKDRVAVEKTIALLEEERAKSGVVSPAAPPPPEAPDPFDLPGRRDTNAASPPPVAPPPPSPPVTESGSGPWLWIAAGVVVVGAAIAVSAVALSGGEEPLGGSLGMTLTL